MVWGTAWKNGEGEEEGNGERRVSGKNRRGRGMVVGKREVHELKE